MRVRSAALLAVAMCQWLPAHAQVDPKAALLGRDGFLLLDAGQPALAAEAFRAALEADPASARLHLGAGMAAFLERRDADARRSLERALTLDPASSEAKRFLGLVLRRQGDLAGAIRVYEGIRDRRDAAETLARWRFELDLHDRMRRAVGERFTVSFEGPAEEVVAAEAIAALDRAYWRIGELLGSTYPLDTISVVLYTREQFRDITRAPPWAGGAYDGTIRVPVGGALDRPVELDRVLSHEFAHALIRSLAERGVPTWLNEGLAAVLESADMSWAEQRLAAAGGGLPLTALGSSFARFDGAEAALAYASSAAAVRRLLDEAGGYAIATLLRDLGAGADFETAFARRMGRPFADFAYSMERPQ